MKFAIRKDDGSLMIEREGVMRPQTCPIMGQTKDGKWVLCGEGCPHFGEVDHAAIEICHGKRIQGEYIGRI